MDEHGGSRGKACNLGLSIAVIGVLIILCIAAVEERIRTVGWPT